MGKIVKSKAPEKGAVKQEQTVTFVGKFKDMIALSATATGSKKKAGNNKS